MGLITETLCFNKNEFWAGIKIYCMHPNSINKEILYSEIICIYKFYVDFKESDCHLIYEKLYEDVFSNGLSIHDSVKSLKSHLKLDQLNLIDIFNDLNGSYLLIRKLVPKKNIFSCNEFYELCFLGFNKNFLVLHSLFNKNLEKYISEDNKACDPYAVAKFNSVIVCYDDNRLTINYDDNVGEKGVNWINTIFKNKLAKIIISNKNVNVSKNVIQFSSQVSVLNYYKLYEKMKLKYAKFLIENWPESTDPQKFVFEDIGIASYLLLLWNDGELPRENTAKQKFVDLGCGNGLLVYILNSEGHKGVGLDVRKRKIWDMYPASVILKEQTVVPGLSSVFPDADWLIGNHSDELTPWLPVMARRSGLQCQCFLLPCCPFKLNGQTYQRRNSGLSTYQDYIKYVQNISELCGFETYIDKLRIPSTKKICIICKKKNLSSNEIILVNEEIDNLISSESQKTAIYDGTESDGLRGRQWMADFKVRESVEVVRNCTQLPKHIINDILLKVVNNCLSQKKKMIIIKKENSEREWNQGGSISLSGIASLLDAVHLKYLKNECKGLQTLIKNNHYVFKISNGFVRIRSPEELLNISEKIFREVNKFKWKQKDCWFYLNHPNGCPLEDSNCSYKHGCD